MIAAGNKYVPSSLNLKFGMNLIHYSGPAKTVMDFSDCSTQTLIGEKSYKETCEEELA